MGKSELTVNKDNLEVKITRVFNAPREKVFEAMTDPEAIPKWWGPRAYTTVVDKMDVRVGGVWRFIHRGKDGEEYAFNGVFKEILPPEKVVQTFEFEPMAGHISTDTAILEELPGNQTKLSITSRFMSLEDLEGMINSGMESGMNESHDRLAELVEAA